MEDAISIKCPKCKTFEFEFSVALLKVTNKVECNCGVCGSRVVITLSKDKVEITAFE